MDQLGPQFTLEVSRAQVTAPDPTDPTTPATEVARAIVAGAVHEATVIDLVRTGTAPPMTVVKRYDVWVAPDGMFLLPFDDDDSAVLHGSVHRGSTAQVAWSNLVAMSADAPTQRPRASMPRREFASMAAFLEWFIDGVAQPAAPDSPMVGAEATVVLVSTGGQAWWYLVRLLDEGMAWGMAPAGASVELHPGRMATLWSRLATVARDQ